MRGIYSLGTIKKSTYSPIIEKIFGTFSAFSVVGTFLSTVVLTIVLHNDLGNEAVQIIGQRIGLVWIGFVVSQLLILRALLYASISPLVKILTSTRKDAELSELEVPQNLSEELQDIYNIVNDSIARTREAQVKMVDAQRNAAIAQTTQMLAHDVRKPFSLLRMGLSMLGNAKDPASVKQVLSRIVPEIDKAVRSVDGMISDVMEVGSPSAILIQEPVSPESLIEATLGEQIRMYPNANISFTYELQHVHMAHVHVQKVSRVFSNVVGNAFQAIQVKGAMWFKTVESDGMIRFCVGNSGSVIPEESLKHLFDAFFTSGKKGGTGLGLAIAQKVVTAHGGRIWCESSKTAEYPDGKVEFFFTLPSTSHHINETTANLPEHSSDVTELLAMSADPIELDLSIEKGELALEDDLIKCYVELGRSIRVLIIDDEGIYRAALASYLTRNSELEVALSIVVASGSDSALEAISQAYFDLIITDVDMGRMSLDGFSLVRELRKRKVESVISVHSNRVVAADSKTAIEAGADNFLPKPMARAQLLRMVLHAVESTKSRKAALDVGTPVSIVLQHGRRNPGVLVVDDSEIVLLGWEHELAADCDFYRMKSFEELQEKLASEPGFLSRISYVVTDMHLDGSYGDGLDVGRLIKSIRSDVPVLLSSDDSFLDSELAGAVDRVIAKLPVGLSRLEQWHTQG